MLLKIFFTFFLLSTVVQLLYWLLIFSRLARYRVPAVKKMAETADLLPVSVIICARNEAEMLKKNLSFFLRQSYPKFEVIVVNDHSSDKTADVLLDFQKKFSILRVITIEHLTRPGKKEALSQGIEAAQFETVLLSDADCRPVSPYWIYYMQAPLRGAIEIGLGYSPYIYQSGCLNSFIRFESVYTAIHYLSFSIFGYPFMGVGRNLIYRKSLFFGTGGFRKHEHIASGDDDLFVNEVAHGSNTTVIMHPEAFVYSVPKSTWAGYYHQKSRHLTAGSHYQMSHQIMLGGLAASHVGHYLGVLVMLTQTAWLPAVILMYLVRMGVVWYVYAGVLKRLQSTALLPWIPFLDAALVLYYILLSPVLFTTGNQTKWNLQ